jgi:spore germination cell wall hydrolase CwlJ-like protein
MTEPSAFQTSKIVKLVKAFLLLVGFYVVMSCLISVTVNKLSYLRGQLEQDASHKEISVKEKTKQLDCLTRNIYWEAATESFEGKVAVAQVTINRAANGNFGNDICGVVYQKDRILQSVVCQFSWVCEHNFQTKPVMPRYYSESEEVAKKVLFEDFRLPDLKQAMYYHADYIKPGWKKAKVAHIGHHIFYK